MVRCLSKNMYKPSNGQIKSRNPNSFVAVQIINLAQLHVYTVHLSSPPPGRHIFSLPLPAHTVTVS